MAFVLTGNTIRVDRKYLGAVRHVRRELQLAAPGQHEHAALRLEQPACTAACKLRY